MHLGQFAYSIARITQNVPIGFVERRQISILEIPEGTENLRWLAVEHLLESTQACGQGHACRNHLGDISIILGFGAIERRFQLGRHQVVERCHEQCGVTGLERIFDPAKSYAAKK